MKNLTETAREILEGKFTSKVEKLIGKDITLVYKDDEEVKGTLDWSNDPDDGDLALIWGKAQNGEIDFFDEDDVYKVSGKEIHITKRKD